MKKHFIAWYTSLGDSRKRDRAILRRAEDPRLALVDQAYWHFESVLLNACDRNHFNQSEQQRLALIACLMAHTKGHLPISFAKALAKKGVTQLRFQKAFSMDDPDHPDYILDQFRHLRRLIKLLNEPFDLATFAQDLFYWPKDQHKQTQIKWAQDFYYGSNTQKK